MFNNFISYFKPFIQTIIHDNFISVILMREIQYIISMYLLFFFNSENIFVNFTMSKDFASLLHDL
jgi:hypothetical protein